MDNIININYAATGRSAALNELGMREMQARAYDARSSQYLLIKAPPASGKSRALMFVALDKLKTRQVDKVIIAVPERSIGKSFASTNLTSNGFHSDWTLSNKYNLCLPGQDTGKVNTFLGFLNDGESILLCTHSTLRAAFDKCGAAKFKKCLVAIDEFHHVSADCESRLGELVRALMGQSSVHILAMTGSYFRGDAVPVLTIEDEQKFKKVTYNYYEQLNGYCYLKSLGIGYHFYTGQYTAAIMEVLDTDKKTILHIPNVNANESTQDKYREVDTIISAIGDVVGVDQESYIISVKRKNDGEIIKVADLVTDDETRNCVITYLQKVAAPEDIDLIIALGMAKEGFDWPYCEHALTVGYRGSLTEIIQIIGRCTRDSANKTHAQFTNLVAAPDAENEEVIATVNNLLKAITASLLMEQVLAPNFNFKTKRINDAGTPIADDAGTISIIGLREPSTKRVSDIIETDLTDLKATVLQDPDIVKSLSGVVDAEVINKVMIPKIIMTKYPGLDEEECEEVRQHLVADLVLRRENIRTEGNTRLLDMSTKFVNIEDINIDLIDSINPFQQAFEVISKSLTPKMLKAIQDCIVASKVSMTDDEAAFLWGEINRFVQVAKRPPSIDSLDSHERRLAEALAYIKQIKRMRANG
jgi:superfamily II DNA or RNA helicase